MPKSKKVDIENRLEKIGLDKKYIPGFLSFVHEKFWKESIKLYKNFEIVRKTLDSFDKVYLLIRDGTGNKDVNLEIEDGKIEYFCNCPHREDSKGCQHAGAVLLYKLMKDEENDFKKELGAVSKRDEAKINKLNSGINYFDELFPERQDVGKKNMIYFNFEDFEKDRQILKIQKGVIKKSGGYGAPLTFHSKDFTTQKWDISKKVKKVLKYIGEGDNFGMGYSSSGFSKSRFYDANTDMMMSIFRDLYFEEQEIILGAIFNREDFKIVWNMKKNKDMKYIIEPFFVCGKKKKSLTKMNLFELGNASLWVFDIDNRCFYGHKNIDDLEVVRSIIRFPKKLEFSEDELKEFFNKYYQKVLDGFELNISKEIKRKSRVVSPVAKIYLERFGSSASIKLRFDYSGKEINYFSSNKGIVIIDNDVIYDIPRDFEEEDRIIEELNNHHIVTHEKFDEFIVDEDLVDFVTNTISKISKLGVVVLGEEGLFNFKVIKNNPKMNMNISGSSDWFDLKGDVKFGSSTVNLEKVFEAIFSNKRFVDLGDGKMGVIPKKWINGMKAYSGFLDLSEDIKLSKSHVAIVDSIIGLASNVSLDKGVEEIIKKFRGFNKIKSVKLSNNIKAKLRPYQKVGYDWLCFLKEYGFNGILADDMGLGKTVQTISILQKLKDEKVKQPFLVVVPTSLVFNWRNEVEKFAPGISLCLHHGSNRANTKEDFEKMIKKYDLIITTYGIVRNDLDFFTKVDFEYIVLDEAHMIKNPMSISAKSVYALKGKNKLIISGTPIQNNLTELWSLFYFLNPGYLGGYNFFREKFVIPIERGGNPAIAEALKKMITPFLLRRTKKVIADELPEKTEIILRSSFNDSEKEFYDNWKAYYKNEIQHSIKENGLSKSKMKVLEGLMKLRQICLHPKLVDAKYSGKAAKFDLLMMEVKKVLNEGHKVLIFSSFVKMLSIIKKEFEKEGIEYSYLDGKTRNRELVVNEFQENKNARPFLISIKAGGVGLNLTSADYVFILDPWWNPAVEAQAMDRAHRIGQSKKVFAYKMIAENTIEEKILKLQESKKKLVKDIIVSEDSGLLKSINVKEIESIFG